MLYDYMKTVQGFIRDRAQKELNPEDLVRYINRARREIALRAQCVRVLTPIQGQITAIQVTNAGSGYRNPTVSITPPDSPSGRPAGLGGAVAPAGVQATALAQQISGAISNISVQNGGDGYFQPAVKINDSHGTGATAVAQVTPINVTVGNQEVYLFSSAPLQSFPGVGSIFYVKSISFIYANYRYSLPCYPLTIYQAYIRQYPQQYLYVPTMAAQIDTGTAGYIYMYPIPSTLYQMEWDCFCLPQDLSDDGQYEAIPQPWQDAVPYFATHLAFLELQNLNAARFYLELHDRMVHEYSAGARPGRMINPYGRW